MAAKKHGGETIAKALSQSFKDEAIRLALEHGYSCAKADEQLGVPTKSLATWTRPHRRKQRSEAIRRGAEQDDLPASWAQIVVRMTDSAHDQPVLANVLQREFGAAEPNRK